MTNEVDVVVGQCDGLGVRAQTGCKGDACSEVFALLFGQMINRGIPKRMCGVGHEHWCDTEEHSGMQILRAEVRQDLRDNGVAARS